MAGESSGQKRPQRNSRRDPRRQPRASLKVVCRKGTLGLGPNIAISLLDISSGGARLVAKQDLKRGEEVEIELDAPSIQKTIKRTASVAWCATSDTGIIIGVTFAEPVSFVELQELARP